MKPGFQHTVHCLAALAGLCVAIAAPSAMAAEAPGPGLRFTSTSYPTNLPPGGKGAVLIQPLNAGAGRTVGQITITDELPPGVTATDAGAGVAGGEFVLDPEANIGHGYWECDITAGAQANSTVTCHNNPTTIPQISGGAGFPTGFRELEPPRENFQPAILIAVNVAEVAGGVYPNSIGISGGESAAINAVQPLSISSQPPGFGISDWTGWFSNADGTQDNRAGSVPYSFTTAFDLNNLLEVEGPSRALNNAGGEPRNFVVPLPPGMIGNPQSVPRCTLQQFVEQACPREAQVGFVAPITRSFALPGVIFNLVPPAGVPAEFGFNIEGVNAVLDPRIRTGADYGITTEAPNTPQQEVIGAIVTLWGVPHDPTHEVWRISEGGNGCSAPRRRGGSGDQICYFGPHPTLKPFLRLPTSCASPMPFSISASSWLDPGNALTEPLSFVAGEREGGPTLLTGCNQLPFDPTITSKPTTDVADAPTGLEFDLRIPQPEVVVPREEEVEGEMETVGAEPAPHEADLKNAVVTLPKGVSVNPASANGLAACTSAQFGLTSPIGAMPITTTSAPAECPNASKIGSVEAISPLLDHPVGDPHGPEGDIGSVYVAAPQDNPFGSLLAIYIVLEDPQTGTIVKLASKVSADPLTGQLTTTLTEAPQLPVNEFKFKFFEGAHAALRTPTTCGSYETTTDFTPWSTPEGADATPGDSFEITQGAGGAPCAASESALPSKPSFTAGTLQPKAGAYSPFVLHLARQDGTQEIKQIDTTLPEGLIGKLAGVGECSDAQIAQAQSRNKLGDGTLEKASPSCPLNSEVGTVSVGAGAGPDPYYVTGHAYLAGPYKGAPLSLEIITPAVAGPYDLGAVAVRTALYVNSETAQIHAVSDELPHILQGIPLDVRAIDLQMARPNFTLNPTSCAKKSILGNAISVLNQSASLSSPFQVGECSVLGFKPKLSINLQGDTKRSGTPALRATLTYPSKGAYSNIAKASVALPHSEFLDQAHIKTICTRVQFAAGNVPGEKCPVGSIYGHARAITPLLDNPLEGPVYLRSSSHPLPDLVAALNGQIQVVLDGTIDSVHGGIRNRFEVVPDAPVSKFTLTMQGGKKGLLENSKDLCRSTNKATANFTAQNGKTYDSRPVVTNSCKRGVKGKKKHKGHGRR